MAAMVCFRLQSRWLGVALLAALTGTGSMIRATGAEPEAGPVLRTDGLGVDQSGRLQEGAVTVQVAVTQPASAQAESQRGGGPVSQAVATVLVKGVQVGVLKGPLLSAAMKGAAVVQIVDLDPTNVYPEVLLSAFTGGAHCCNQVQVLTRLRGEAAWRIVALEPFNGGPAPARSPLGGTVPLVVSADDRFLYAFACYACGRAPTRLWQLSGDRFVDVSHQPRYRPLYRRELESYQDLLEQSPQPDGNPNGWLAAYVATKALVGERGQGWQQMLKRYSPTSDWGLKACLGGYGSKGCRTPEVVYPNFPEALKAFLQRNGYWN